MLPISGPNLATRATENILFKDVIYQLPPPHLLKSIVQDEVTVQLSSARSTHCAGRGGKLLKKKSENSKANLSTPKQISQLQKKIFDSHLNLSTPKKPSRLPNKSLNCRKISQFPKKSFNT